MTSSFRPLPTDYMSAEDEAQSEADSIKAEIAEANKAEEAAAAARRSRREEDGEEFPAPEFPEF